MCVCVCVVGGGGGGGVGGGGEVLTATVPTDVHQQHNSKLVLFPTTTGMIMFTPRQCYSNVVHV